MLIVLTSVLFTACTDTVEDFILPESSPKPVVLCFLSPDQNQLSLTLTFTHPVNTHIADSIHYANVQITNKTDTATLIYDSVVTRKHECTVFGN